MNEQFKALIKLLLPPVAAFLVAGIADAGTFIEQASTFTGIATLVPLFVEAIKTAWDFKDKSFLGMKVARWFSWLFSVLLVYLSSVAGWAFQDFSTFWVLAWGIGAGLVSNGYFTAEQVKALLIILMNARKK